MQSMEKYKVLREFYNFQTNRSLYESNEKSPAHPNRLDFFPIGLYLRFLKASPFSPILTACYAHLNRLHHLINLSLWFLKSIPFSSNLTICNSHLKRLIFPHLCLFMYLKDIPQPSPLAASPPTSFV